MITKKCPACWKDIQEKFGLSQQSNVVYNGSEETTTEISPNENDVPNEKVEFATTERVVLPQRREWFCHNNDHSQA